VRLNLISSPIFLRSKKKQTEGFQKELDKQVKSILENPLAGKSKKGVLKGVRVQKFKYKNQLYLISYEPDFKKKELYLYTFGAHEGFYRDLERYAR